MYKVRHTSREARLSLRSTAPGADSSISSDLQKAESGAALPRKGLRIQATMRRYNPQNALDLANDDLEKLRFFHESVQPFLTCREEAMVKRLTWTAREPAITFQQAKEENIVMKDLLALMLPSRRQLTRDMFAVE